MYAVGPPSTPFILRVSTFVRMATPSDTWCSWSGGNVSFAMNTCCVYLDILYYDSDGEGTCQTRQCYEGTVDDDSLSGWFERVKTIAYEEEPR